MFKSNVSKSFVWVKILHLIPDPQLMAETANAQTLAFYGERMSWLSPASLEELIQLKTKHPKAPLVMGNTNIGRQEHRDGALGRSLRLDGQTCLLCVEGPDIKFKGVVHPLVISPSRIKELYEVSRTSQGEPRFLRPSVCPHLRS